MADTSLRPPPPSHCLQCTSLFLLLVALIAQPPHAKAQAEDITGATPASHDQIMNWLYSGDPRRIAWGAHFASEQNDQPALAVIVQLLARWTPPTPPPSQTGIAPRSPEAAEAGAMLDAIIQRGEKIPQDTLAHIAAFFPNQAAILAVHQPIEEATPLLLIWYAQRSTDDPNSALLARVASIILSHAPPPGFAATVLSESEEKLRIFAISDPEDALGFGVGGGSCAGAGVPLPPTGWPTVFTYALHEDYRQPPQPKAASTSECQSPPPPEEPSAPILVEAAGDRIRYYRYDLYKILPICAGIPNLNATNRHYLLAQMLGIADTEIPWRVETSPSIVWQSDEHFTRQVSTTVAAEEAKLRSTVDAIQSKGLLTPDEAATSRPQLAVIIQDFRNPAGPPLPQLAFPDPRTTLAH